MFFLSIIVLHGKRIEVKMTADNIGDSVGKKLVAALKIQDDSENIVDFAQMDVEPSDVTASEDIQEDIVEEEIPDSNNVDAVFQNNLNQSMTPKMGLYTMANDFDLPENVAILNKLIGKLPVGVSRQTGATIIRQTMEALGIPMQSVIQEAKQVQENLTHRAAECQQNIIDYKKQISTLELQSLQFQRQAIMMNDMINLFVNSGNI